MFAKPKIKVRMRRKNWRNSNISSMYDHKNKNRKAEEGSSHATRLNYGYGVDNAIKKVEGKQK